MVLQFYAECQHSTDGLLPLSAEETTRLLRCTANVTVFTVATATVASVGMTLLTRGLQVIKLPA